MPRKLAGSVRLRNNTWNASVPRRDGSGGRLETSFSTEAEAQRWICQQIKRLQRGLPAQLPERDGVVTGPATWSPSAPSSPRDGLSLLQVATIWHNERYEELRGASAGRSDDVWRDMELHILPGFSDLFELDMITGRQLIKDWLRAMAGLEPETPNSRFTVGKTYASLTVQNYLWILREIVTYARLLDATTPDYTCMLSVVPNDEPRQDVQLVSIADCVQIAANLHVVHQLMLWLLRLCGLRISEAYGLTVSRFFVDDDGTGFLIVDHQDGWCVKRDKDGGRHSAPRKTPKTKAGYRLMPLPALLTALIGNIIAAFHTDADGVINPLARLVPTIQSANGGKDGFRTALKAAARALDLDVDASDDDTKSNLRPHDLRKNFGTDLAWSDEIQPLLKRRAMGHRAGDDVFELVYTLDTRLKKHLGPVAAMFDEQLAVAGITTLMVPTIHRPLYLKSADPTLIASINAPLAEAGWQIDENPDEIDVAEAAALLGMVETATRRLFVNGHIPARKSRKEWRATRTDVLGYRDRLSGFRLLPDIADDAGISYDAAYMEVKRLGIVVEKDSYTRQLLYTPAHATLIVAAVRQTQALRDRSMTIAEAMATLGSRSHSAINKLADEGVLHIDTETDASGKRYVTRASVEAERNRRLGGCGPQPISVQRFRLATGFTSADVDRLVCSKHLVRGGRGALTRESVLNWATGFRPDLLGSSYFA